MRRRLGPVRVAGRVATSLVLSSGLLLIGCGDDAEPFCEELRNDRALAGVGDALGRGDISAASAAIDDLERLAEDAPDGVQGDLRTVVEAVRRIVETMGREGAARSESVESLNPDLAGRYSEAARNVAKWASAECAIELR